MRGQTVVCKDFSGVPVLGKVWEDTGALIFIHSDAQYEAREQGHPFLEAVGFPVEDVYKPSNRVHSHFEGWDGLTPYRDAADRT